MPTRFEIGGEEQDTSGKSIEEVAKMVEAYFKQKKIKFNIKKVEDDEKREWWYANGGTMTFITATEAEIEEIDADEYGELYSFNDERKVDTEGVEEGYVKPMHHLEAPYEKLFEENKKLKEQVRDLLEENEKNQKSCEYCGGYNSEFQDNCDSCGRPLEVEEEEECEVCDTKTKTTIKTYGCMDMSVCKNC
mgnify:CR=1 FL=1